MAYYICIIKTESALAETVASLLSDSGAVGTASEGAPLVRASIAAGNAEIWDSEQMDGSDDSVMVHGYFTADDSYDGNKVRTEAAMAVFNAAFGADLKADFSYLEDEAWQDGWKQYYKPFRVGERLVIKPSWEEYTPKERDLVLELDPGLAFGTGSHPTTNGALRLLEKYVRDEVKVIDCGCGSGVLAVAAALFGAGQVYAVDVDHDAILATVKNTRINHLFQKIEVIHADVTKKRFQHLAPFDVIVANIVADVILPLLPFVAPLAKPGGVLIAGGIIAHREEEVTTSIGEHGFKIVDILRDGEWITLAALKE